MTATVISLLSILIGIIGANAYGFLFKKRAFSIVGNTISGVFGSILFIKTFGRLGFDPNSIIASNDFSYWLLSINLIVSFLGGILTVYLLKN